MLKTLPAALGALLAVLPDYRRAAIASTMQALLLMTALAALAAVAHATAQPGPAWAIINGAAFVFLLVAGFAALLDVPFIAVMPRSTSAAKVALHNEPVFKDGFALNADESVPGGFGDTPFPVALLVFEVARIAAKATSVALRPGLESTKFFAAIRADDGGGFSQDNSPDSKPRASITFGANGTGTSRNTTIELYDNANLSSLLHETGHFYLEMLGDLAEMEGVAQNVKDDYAAILKWLGVESRSQITVEHHEMFARGNEAYLMEGKAPSPELRNAFQRFTAWLKSIYKELKALNVELSDEVRGVFDRHSHEEGGESDREERTQSF